MPHLAGPGLPGTHRSYSSPGTPSARLHGGSSVRPSPYCSLRLAAAPPSSLRTRYPALHRRCAVVDATKRKAVVDTPNHPREPGARPVSGNRPSDPASCLIREPACTVRWPSSADPTAGEWHGKDPLLSDSTGRRVYRKCPDRIRTRAPGPGEGEPSDRQPAHSRLARGCRSKPISRFVPKSRLGFRSCICALTLVSRAWASTRTHRAGPPRIHAPKESRSTRYDFIVINRRFYAIQGNSMPLFTVTMRSGRTVAEKDAISAAIHEASVSAGYPEDDHFQRFISLEEADLRISPRYPDLQKPRSEHVLMIEAVLSSGTGEQRKRSLLSAIVARLQAAGMDPNDIMVFFGEVDRASSSFGGGRPALPVDLRPQKWSRARPPSIRRRPGKRAKTCELGSSPTSVGSARLHELPAAVPARCRRTRRSEDRAVRGPGRGDRRVSCDHP
ncbi:tautomerase family protein [Streptomyces sp. LN499]|uniref:tautomerase family protein n=1 Tax=Streptomyces sp. LN499 TaxID=3112977 RepID=UPI00371FC0FB